MHLGAHISLKVCVFSLRELGLCFWVFLLWSCFYVRIGNFFTLYAFGCSNFIESLCFLFERIEFVFLGVFALVVFLCKNWKKKKILLITQKFD